MTAPVSPLSAATFVTATEFSSTAIAAVSPPPFEVPDVLLHMTTTRSAKQWLPDYWREVIDWCGARGLSVGMIGGKPQIERERYHAGDWEEQLLLETALIDLRGETALPQLAGVFARARAAVVVDAGPMHIAAAVGTPTMGIFGPTSPDHWAPLNGLAATVQTKTTVPCQPCHRPVCTMNDHRCMRDIPASDVVAIAERVLAEAGARVAH